MRIGEVAQRSGVPVKTIRYYEDIGVLDLPQRSASGYREYDDNVLERLAFVRSAQTVGPDSHAWFAGYAPYDSPKYAIAVFVEHGGHGGEAAAPVASKILEILFPKKK